MGDGHYFITRISYSDIVPNSSGKSYFFSVPTAGKFCVFGLSQKGGKVINEMCVVKFQTEEEAGAVILSTRASEEYLKTCDFSRLFFSHRH